jgi:pimeloyl-ACP methyl ester carboxylesterase
LGLCTVPTLLLAENSKAHDIRRVAANAHRLMPQAVTTVIPGATHHSIPTENPAPLNRQLRDFLA